MGTHVVVLNYEGRALLAECLPSVVRAASRVPCPVTVVDNDSKDDSVAYLRREWPDVRVIRMANRGLASFNEVLARLEEQRVILLNNDVKLEPDAIAPLADALLADDAALFAAPQCWTFDGATYEGMRTLVRSRFGMVQGMCRVPGHVEAAYTPDLTASAGPVLAVDRAKFLELGGYDPIYFPGRIEDLDLGFRGWMAGWTGLYVPTSVAYHRGFGSFGPAFGPAGCDRLAARNTLIFSWKNLAGKALARHLAWLPARLGHAAATGRSGFVLALLGALARLGPILASRRAMAVGRGSWTARQDAFFERFRW